MRDNFETCLQTVLRYEGGKVDDPRDPGGRTAFGITQNTYNGWRAAKKLPAQDVFNITQGEVAMIYRQNYWDKINGDNLPDGVDIAVFDFAVNSGVSRAAKYLQSTVGVTRYENLPEKARAYLSRIEELAGVPVDIISTGPDREQTIIKSHPFE